MNLATRVAVAVEPTPVETAPQPELTARALLVGAAIGRLKGLAAVEIAALTWANADRLFGL